MFNKNIKLTASRKTFSGTLNRRPRCAFTKLSSSSLSISPSSTNCESLLSSSKSEEYGGNCGGTTAMPPDAIIGN